ncbi:hypothetical protein [Mycoplasma sp. Z386]
MFILFQLIFVLFKDSAIQFLFRQNFASSINNLFVFVIGIVFFGISIEVYNKWGNDLAARWDVEFYAELPQPFEKIKEAIGGAVKLATKVGGVGAFLGKNAKGKFLGTGVGQKYLEKKANVVGKYSEKIRNSAFGQSKIGKKLLSNKKLTNWQEAIKKKQVRQGKGEYVTSQKYSEKRQAKTNKIFQQASQKLSSDNIKAKVREKYNDFQNTNKGIYDRFKEQFDKGIVTKNTDEKLLTNNQLQLNNLKTDNKPLIDKLNALPAKFTETTKEGNNTPINTIQKETIIKESKTDIKEIKSEKIKETVTNNKESIKETVNKEHISNNNVINTVTNNNSTDNTNNNTVTHDINKVTNSTPNDNVSDTNKVEKINDNKDNIEKQNIDKVKDNSNNNTDNTIKSEPNKVEEKPQDVVKDNKKEENKKQDNNKTTELNENKVNNTKKTGKSNDDKFGTLIIHFENIPKTRQENKPEENKLEQNKPEENKPEENKAEENKADWIIDLDNTTKDNKPEVDNIENNKPDWIIDLDNTTEENSINTTNNIKKLEDVTVENIDNKSEQNNNISNNNIEIVVDKNIKEKSELDDKIKKPKNSKKSNNTSKIKDDKIDKTKIDNKINNSDSKKVKTTKTDKIKLDEDKNKSLKTTKPKKVVKNNTDKKPNYDLGINYLNNSLSKEKTKQSLEINKKTKNNYDLKQWVKDNFKDKPKK